MSTLTAQIEEAIRSTLVIENKNSVHFAVDKIIHILNQLGEPNATTNR